jgi:hypothetical protein
MPRILGTGLVIDDHRLSMATTNEIDHALKRKLGVA